MGSSRVFLRVTTGIAILLLYCSPLLANSISYSLNAPNSELSGSPGPYGTVRLSLNADGTISVLVKMASNFGIAGGGPAFGLNGPAGLTFSAFTYDFSCCEPSRRGYEDFQYVIKGPPRKRHAPISFFFIVSVPGGFTSVNQLGNNFMAHVIARSANPTGYTTVTVPDGDPSTLTLLLLGLGGSGVAAMMLERRVRRMRDEIPNST